MYRINFYPEFAARQRELHRRTVRFGVLATLVAVELGLTGVVVLSGLLLGDQARALRGRVDRLAVQASTIPGADDELGWEHEIITRRRERLDWAPKLAALSEHCAANLGLLELKAETGNKRGHVRLEVSGSFRTPERDAAAVLRFVEELSADPRITIDFPAARLESVDWSGPGRFRIVCERVEEQS